MLGGLVRGGKVIDEETRVEEAIVQNLSNLVSLLFSHVKSITLVGAIRQTFFSLFSSLRYSRISAFPSYQGICSKLDLPRFMSFTRLLSINAGGQIGGGPTKPTRSGRIA